MDVGIREIQMLELEIAKEFKRICDKNNIPYIMIGGTLLGAARHKGFIPWDDDMDVALMRDDYMKFVECAKTDLDERFVLQTWDDGDDYGYIFSKLKLKDTEAIETICSDLNLHKGVWVDIFTYSPCDEAIGKNKFYFKRIQLLTKFNLIKKGYKLNRITASKAKQMVNNILGIASKFCSAEFLKKRLTALWESSIREDGDYILIWDTNLQSGFHFPRTMVEDLIELPFEGESFLAPKRYKEYLERSCLRKKKE